MEWVVAGAQRGNEVETHPLGGWRARDLRKMGRLSSASRGCGATEAARGAEAV